MNIRIIQWNISFRCKANKIADFLSLHIDGPTIVNLQEVLESTYIKLVSQLNPDSTVFSLDLRKPGKFDGKNRKLGVATLVFGGNITTNELVLRSVFPDRTLFCIANIKDQDISILHFHSLTGVDYKKAKSSNFSSIAEFIYEHSDVLDFFTCDANEPKVDSLDDDVIEFFDNRDKGINAGLIFGKGKVHSLNDAYKIHARSMTGSEQINSLAYSHVISKKFYRRYDHVYCSENWNVTDVKYLYDESIKASSDHAMVVCDFSSKRLI